MWFHHCVFSLIILIVPSIVTSENFDDVLTLPDGFLIGTATSAYQIEGAWNVSGEGENVWDRFVHTSPEKIVGNQTGDFACDSYHKFKEDVKLIKEMGLDYYRFSLSWSRILPTGYSNKISQDGLNYYHALLDELEAKKITPMVTLYHWDHPQLFQDFGGWTNEAMIELFADYARVVFREFGDRVKLFATFNEPVNFCADGLYTGDYAPGLKLGKHGEYLCTNTVLKAHAMAYHIYKREFSDRQKGKVGIVLNCRHFYPKNSGPEGDELVEVAHQYFCGRYAAPIFSKTGDYPEVVKDRIAKNSEFEGLARSRLPVLTKEWIDFIRGSADFMGLNHYSSKLVEAAPRPKDTIYFEDHGLAFDRDPKWPLTPAPFIDVVPQGMHDVLVRIKQDFGDVPIYITENGVADDGKSLKDSQRLEYLYSYMKSMLTAIKEHGCNVKSYTVWSLLDNYEWNYGYSLKFGLYRVDFSHPNRTRTPKASVGWLKSVLKTRKLQPIAPYLTN